MKRSTAQRFSLWIDYAVWLFAMIGVGTVLIWICRMAMFVIERVTR